MIQNRTRSLKRTHRHVCVLWGWSGGQTRQDVNGTVYGKWSLLHAYTHRSVPGRLNTFGLEPHSLLLIFDGVLHQLSV